MKRDTVNYFAVGLFVLAGLAVLLFAMFHLLGGAGDGDVYYTRYANVAGLSAGTAVTYEGYRIGRIAAIEPERTGRHLQYRVEMHIRKDWRIPVDSITAIYSESLLADFVLNISDGQSTEFLVPGATLSSRPGGDLFATLGSLAGELGQLSAGTLRPLLENLGRTMQSVGGELDNRLPAILTGLQTLVDKLDVSATHLSGVINAGTAAQARRVLDNVDGAAADFHALGGTLATVSDEAGRLLAKLDALVTTSQPELARAVVDLRRTLQQVARHSDAVLQNLDNTARNASEFSRQIRENPARLLNAPAPTDPGGRRE